MSPSRLLTLSGLAVAAALCAGTAASVYAASLPRQHAFESGHAWRAGAVPDSPTLSLRAADRTQPAAARLEAAVITAVGVCLSPRELLLGVQPTRRAALDSLAQRLHDLPQAPGALAAARSVLAAFDSASPVGGDRPTANGGPVELRGGLTWLVPDRILRRVRLCAVLMAR